MLELVLGAVGVGIVGGGVIIVGVVSVGGVLVGVVSVVDVVVVFVLLVLVLVPFCHKRANFSFSIPAIQGHTNEKKTNRHRTYFI